MYYISLLFLRKKKRKSMKINHQFQGSEIMHICSLYIYVVIIFPMNYCDPKSFIKIFDHFSGLKYNVS